MDSRNRSLAQQTSPRFYWPRLPSQAISENCVVPISIPGSTIKTGGKEGMAVLAAADGYVSRIRVSASGYGKSVYITHPSSGLTTVYGHLRMFAPFLEDTIRIFQYQNEKNELEWFPDSTQYLVAAGQLIGFTGNTGSSQGPHLHFETRNTQSEVPFDPVLAGYRFQDTVPPVLKSIVIYAPGPLGGLFGAERLIMDADSLIKNQKTPVRVPANGFFTGFAGWDLAGTDTNALGIYRADLYLDDQLYFSIALDSIPFSDGKHIRAFTDSPLEEINGYPVSLELVLPGNPLCVYPANQGMMILNDTLEHVVRLVLTDRNGNDTWCSFRVQVLEKSQTKKLAAHSVPLVRSRSAVIKKSKFRFEVPVGGVYEDCSVQINKGIPPPLFKTPERLLSSIVEMGPWDLLFDSAPTLRMIAALPVGIDSTKMLLVRIDSTGTLNGAGGTWKDGWVSTTIRKPGLYAVSLDTVPPFAKQPAWETDDLTSKKRLVLPVEDELSGIAEWKCKTQTGWLRCLYCTGQGVIEVFPEDMPAEGIIEVTVTDSKHNTTEFPLLIPPR